MLVAGIQHLRDGLDPQVVIAPDMAVFALVGTAPDADAGVFPLNQPIAIETNNTALLQGLGATGTLADGLSLISAQLEGVGAARGVVVRVEEGVDATATIANLIGMEGSRTGVWALLDAPYDLARTPRLIAVPGYTSQTASGVYSIPVTNGGSGYTSAPTVSFTGGDGTGLAATAIVQDGVVTRIEITNYGANYTSAPTAVFSGGGGTGAAAQPVFTQSGNAVCAIMPTICDRLNAVFLPEGPTNTRTAYVNWLETLPRTENFFHPIRQSAKVQSGVNVVTKPASPALIGLYIRRIAEKGGVPSGSIANQQVYGVVGFEPEIPFSITDGSTQGQEDLSIGAGIFIRGDVGVDGSLTDGGFAFWGTDTLSVSSDWLFTHVVLLRTYIELLQVKATRTYLGRENITLQTGQIIYNTLDQQLRPMKHDGHIIDYDIGFDPGANTSAELRLGDFDIAFRAEEPPVLRKLIIRSRRWEEALDRLATNLATRLTSALV